MDKYVIVLRCTKNTKAVYGIIIVKQGDSILFVARTIENLSKIFPDGVYDLRFEYSPKFGRSLWELYGIKGRSEIKIHVVNFYDELDGCIGVGATHIDIKAGKHDYDGIKDLASSAITLQKFHTAMNGISKSKINVISAYA